MSHIENIKSLNALLEKSFKENWERPALSNYGGDTLTYADIAEKIAWLHIFFKQCGISKGDKIAICSRNQTSWAVTYLAVLTYGAVAVPILHEFKPSNTPQLVEHSDARMLFVGTPMWDTLCYEEFSSVECIVRFPNFDIVSTENEKLLKVRESLDRKFAEKYPDGFHPEHIRYYADRPGDLALISYTSGTSGFSKGVMIPYRAICSNVAFAMEVEPQMDNTSNMLSILPTAHMFGMLFEFLFEMCIGAHVHFLTRLPSPRILLSALSSIKPDEIIAVPIIVEKIYKTFLVPLISRKAIKLFLKMPIIDRTFQKKVQQKLFETLGGNFKEVIIGGAAFNKDVEHFLYKIGFPFTVGYGMTECGPIITYAPFDKTKLFSAGYAAPRMSIKVDSKDPVNIAGEILVKGDNLFVGYYKNEKATAKAFTKDGWFHTGDVGTIDADGYLFLKGRKKSMIVGSSGQNIYPEEVESVLNDIAEVVESIVVEDNGKLVGLVYFNREMVDIQRLSEDELADKCNEVLKQANGELPKYSQLSLVEAVPEEFEKTPKQSIKRYLYQR